MSDTIDPRTVTPPEPWSINERGDVLDANGKQVPLYKEDVTQRIIACVNACRFMDTQALGEAPTDLQKIIIDTQDERSKYQITFSEILPLVIELNNKIRSALGNQREIKWP